MSINHRTQHLDDRRRRGGGKPRLLALALAVGLGTASADTYIINANLWLGTKDSNWFDPANWYLGDKYAAPLPQLVVWVAPIRNGSPGVPPNTFIDVPKREAVLNQPFLANNFHLVGWDGMSQVRLVAGGSLYTTNYQSGEIGNADLVSVTGGVQQKANLILDGGSIAGDWNFYANSRVEVRGQYAQPLGSWNGVVGELAITSGSSFNGGSLTHATVNRIVNGGTLNIVANQTLRLAGEVLNNGTISAPTGGTAITWITSDTTLAGSGTTFLYGATGTNYVMGGAGVLTIGAAQTVHAAVMLGGSDGLNIVNRGRLIAGPGRMEIYSKANGALDNTGGVIVVPDGASVRMNQMGGGAQGRVSGGTLEGGGNSQFIGHAENVNFVGPLVFSGMLSGQTSVAPGAVLTIGKGNGVDVSGRIDNRGRLVLGYLPDQQSGLLGTASMFLSGATNLAGSGTTQLLNNFSQLGGYDTTLTIAPEHTLQGGGLVWGNNLLIRNQGRIAVQGDLQTGPTSVLMMNLTGTSLVNEGRIDVDAGSRLQMNGQTLQQITSTAVTHVDGSLAVGTLDLAAGVLSGSGTIDGTVVVGAGTIAPGNSPGKLSINGNLVMGADSMLQIQVYGGTQGLAYDWLQVNGNVSLNGKLLVDFGSYTPKVGDSFEFLSGKGFNGTFSAVEAPGYVLDMSSNGQTFAVTVESVASVPEPAACLQWLAGLGALAAVLARRERRTAVARS